MTVLRPATYAVQAFRMHFRPTAYTGSVAADTAAILFALLEKYRGHDVQPLL